MSSNTRHRQEWHAESYERDTGFVSDYGEAVIEWLNPQLGESILDLGCGDGRLTEKIVDRGANVIGFDASENFIEAAKRRGLNVQLGDGHALPFDQAFEAVFSNAALHWMLEPHEVLKGVHRALKPNGRFVGEFGGFGNAAAVITAMRAVGTLRGGNADLVAPWYFPTVEQYTQMLQKHGFTVDRIISFYRPTPVPKGMRAWLEVMRAPFFDQFGDQKETVYRQVTDALKPALQDHQGNWFVDYVRLRFSATKS